MPKIKLPATSQTIVFLKKNRYGVLASFFLILFLLPSIVLGENSYVVIHDNLDILVPNAVTLARTERVLNASGQDVVPQIMNGIPRIYLNISLNIIQLFFTWFQPFVAYLLNSIIVHIIAFVGMYLFLSKYVLIGKTNMSNYSIIAWGISLTFAILPFYSMFGLSVAGQPLLLFSFFNLMNKKGSFYNFIILILFPFYSFTYYPGIFLIAAFFLIILYFTLKNKIFYKKALCGLIIFIIAFIVSEYDLVRLVFFDPSFISQRFSWNLSYLSDPLNDVIRKSFWMFLEGQYHAPSLHGFIIFLSLLALAIIFFKRTFKLKNLLLSLLVIQILISLIYGFSSWDKLIPIKEALNQLSSINIGRFHWLSPFIWYVVFAISLIIIFEFLNAFHIWKFKRLNIIIIGLLISFQLFIILINNPEFKNSIYDFLDIPGYGDENISYKQFFSQDLFEKIKLYIGLPQETYRVVSIGIHPAIALYNGFYCLDGYQANYPLTYKQEFRLIIADELNKNRTWQEYFDYYGVRIYVFSSEIPDFLTTKDKGRIIKNMSLNTEAFKQMGGVYIFSAAEIKNYSENNLDLLSIFEDQNSVWKIYLYKAK